MLAGQVIYILYTILFTGFTVYRPGVGKFLSVKGQKENILGLQAI